MKKRSLVFLLATFFFFIFLLKLDQILVIDKSNYYLPFEELNYLIEYCKLKEESILNYFDNYKINNSTVLAKKGNLSFYIECQ
ncbi:MAG TPA: hypothetical protein EYH54_00590 [Nautiliaceae bacterium]|nr:hypothetical protein [Nautiliaceae bacterium]